jgi:hypothetical protein
MDESYYRFEVRIPKPTRRWFRFSLLSLLILVTGICLVLGLWPQPGMRKWHTFQLRQLPARSVADVVEHLFVDMPADVLERSFENYSKSKTVTGDDGGKPSVEFDVDTNSIRFLATEAELRLLEEVLLKLGESPNPPTPQRELPPKSKFRLLSHQQAATGRKWSTAE